jgi:hypothetical protein
VPFCALSVRFVSCELYVCCVASKSDLVVSLALIIVHDVIKFRDML